MGDYSQQVFDSLQLQNTNLQNLCNNTIQNLVNTIHAETSQTILGMVFRDKNIDNLFPEKLDRYTNKFHKRNCKDFIGKLKFALPETEFLPNEIIVGCFQIYIDTRSVPSTIPFQVFSSLGRYTKIEFPHKGAVPLRKVQFEGEPLPLTNEYISIIVNYIENLVLKDNDRNTKSLDFFKKILEIYKQQHPLIDDLKQNQNILDETNEKVEVLNIKEEHLNNIAIQIDEEKEMIKIEKEEIKQ